MLILCAKMTHVIGFVCWFAGLFYLPRLFVYHANTHQSEGFYDTLCTMERKLFFYIMTPSLVLTFMGGGVLLQRTQDWRMGWMHGKLVCVAVLVVYHFLCQSYVSAFQHRRNTHSHIYFRWFNEIPSVLLLLIVWLVIFRP